MNPNLQKMLAQSVAEILRQGVELLKIIDDETYTRSAESAFADGGAVGGHFRHCLEFVNCFLYGVGAGRIDYNRRERSHQIEANRQFAVEEYEKTIARLESFAQAENTSLFVKPEDAAREEDYWCQSSIERELEFLHSHTIHHYALIGFKLRAFGFDLPIEFGVAPSTLKFWNEQREPRKDAARH